MKPSDTTGSKTNTRFLLDAISEDKIHLTRFILDALDGKIIDSKTEGTQTPLISAVFLQDQQARSKFMDLLLQRGASVNCPDESGRTPLSYACEMGHLDAVKILVKNNADPEVADRWGNTALMFAAAAGHSAIVEFLARAFKRLGLQVDRQNKVGNSAVEVARYLGHTECLRALGSNFRKVCDDGVGEKLSTVNIHDDKEKFFESLKGHHREIQPTARGETSAEDESRLPVGLGRKRSLVLRNRIQSMDSIEEYEKESDVLLPSLSSQSVVTPKPTPRFFPNPKQREQTSTIDPLPLLSRGPVHSNSVFYSPRPFKTSLRSGVSPSGPLGILLTPISGREEQDNIWKAKKLPFDLPVRRFDENYYQKRCSLPTSTLAPPATERLMSLCRSKTLLKSPATARTLQPADFTQTASTVTSFSSKLLRRFTFPDFKKISKESQEVHATQMGACAGHGIPRSETFPLANDHPQVASKPSVDSISAVKCEFDFHIKTASNF
ncbi:uncharacterized protein [Paramisgurnus dabryanus]|uniref:uncharacterized protein n=1 Tax=Paramisgurnus dabryanus TaxID=90735 RepID=UPI0031F3FF60